MSYMRRGHHEAFAARRQPLIVYAGFARRGADDEPPRPQMTRGMANAQATRGGATGI